jgi:hypothetical protein
VGSGSGGAGVNLERGAIMYLFYLQQGREISSHRKIIL